MNITWTRAGGGWRAVLVALAGCLAAAGTSAGVINADSSGVAIHGYDPVAYFADGHPESGDPRYTFHWMDAEWRFSSAAHRDAFAKRPEKYAPSYGGFCAYAASYGQTADVDPTAWTIIDGRLYLNYSPRIKQIWQPRAAEFIEDADAQWPEVEAEKRKQP